MHTGNSNSTSMGHRDRLRACMASGGGGGLESAQFPHRAADSQEIPASFKNDDVHDGTSGYR